MNLLVLRKLLVLINLRLLVNQDSALISVRKNVKKKIAQFKGGKKEDLNEFVGKVQAILSKADNVKSEGQTEAEDVDMTMFAEVKEDANE